MTKQFGFQDSNSNISDILNDKSDYKKIGEHEKEVSPPEEVIKVSEDVSSRVNPKYKPIEKAEVEKPYLSYLKKTDKKLKSEILNFRGTTKKLLVYIVEALDINETTLSSRVVTKKILQEALGVSRTTVWRSVDELEKAGVLTAKTSGSSSRSVRFVFGEESYKILKSLISNKIFKVSVENGETDLDEDFLLSIIPDYLKKRGCTLGWLKREIKKVEENRVEVERDYLERLLTNFSHDLELGLVARTSNKGPMGLLVYCLRSGSEYIPRFSHNEIPEFEDFIKEFAKEQESLRKRKIDKCISLIDIQWSDFILDLSEEDYSEFSGANSEDLGLTPKLTELVGRRKVFLYFIENVLQDAVISGQTYNLKSVAREYLVSTGHYKKSVLPADKIEKIDSITEYAEVKDAPSSRIDEVWIKVLPALEMGNEHLALDILSKERMNKQEADDIKNMLFNEKYAKMGDEIIRKIDSMAKPSFTLELQPNH